MALAGECRQRSGTLSHRHGCESVHEPTNDGRLRQRRELAAELRRLDHECDDAALGRSGTNSSYERPGPTARRRVLDLLLAHGEVTPTALAAELPFTRQAVTKHLAVRDRASLVESTRHGREVRYSIRPEHLDIAVRAMAKVAARWDARLEAIKRLAESEAAARKKRPRR